MAMTGDGTDGSSLRVRRGQDGGGMLRTIQVLVDGDVALRLGQGEEGTIPLAPGEHVVQAKMDWATSRPLAVALRPGTQASVEVALPGSAVWRSFLTPSRALSVTLRS